MKRWKLPRLSRGWKITCNFALALLFLTVLWSWCGYPIPAPRLNFRRMERTSLIGPGEIQGVFRTDEQNHECWVVGREEDQVVLLQSWNWNGGTLDFWPKTEEGPALVPVPTWVSQFDQEREVVAVDVPEETASAQLELKLNCWHNQEDLSIYQTVSAIPEGVSGEALRWERTWTVDGELLRDGGVLFRVVSPDEHTDPSVNVATVERMALGQVTNWNAYRQSDRVRGVNCHMEAVFYDKDGAELGRAALSTPEGGDNDAA